ncbi:hypothetical protein TcasGA2_TC033881 [Tribolium castaneum]|uniref:Uncharacterized protein n=1 Tax=Tribolium castaneum TaxID=7070 RepID=A0A139WEC6_TRICA|nr:hypothetical protein TcasGA2_TC033881 [Tribolium castaneum]
MLQIIVLLYSIQQICKAAKRGRRNTNQTQDPEAKSRVQAKNWTRELSYNLSESTTIR